MELAYCKQKKKGYSVRYKTMPFQNICTSNHSLLAQLILLVYSANVYIERFHVSFQEANQNRQKFFPSSDYAYIHRLCCHRE